MYLSKDAAADLGIESGYRCDAEVGHYKRGWHGCNRKAVISSEGRYGMELHFCAKHQSRAFRNIKLLRSEYSTAAGQSIGQSGKGSNSCGGVREAPPLSVPA